MSFRLPFLVFIAFSVGVRAESLRVATFNIKANLFVPPGGGTPYFNYGIGPPGQVDYESVKSVIDRIDADVVALQEIHEDDVSAGYVSNLATSLGYPYLHISTDNNAFDPSLLVGFFSRFPFISKTLITSPAGSKDMTRLIAVVKVDVPGTTRDPILAAAHLKSASDASDLFQRTVEMRRLTNYLTAQGLTQNDNFFILGDFNLSDNDRTFAALPASGLPASFSLGGDITFPISYYTNPVTYFSNPAVNRILPRQLDGSTATLSSSGSAIDLFLVSGIVGSRPLRTEIYNSLLDTSNSTGLPKSGAPLPSGTSGTASDHFALFGDFELDPALPYKLTAPGDAVTEIFNGFPGTYDPYPWVTTGGGWQGAETGTSAPPGFRAYGPAGDPSLGFVSGGNLGTATATFVNHSAEILTALQISFTAEQWRAVTGGTSNGLDIDLIVAGVSRPIPSLSFTAATNLPTGPIANGASTLKSALLTGLSIAPGASFDLRFNFTPGSGSGIQPSDVFINEFHYDNDGTDTGEFIEVVVAPGFAGPISNINVVLYNGEVAGNAVVYNTLNLQTDFSLVRKSNSFEIYIANLSGIQNGPRDGLAVVNTGTSQVLQRIAYEGSFTSTALPAAGSFPDIGVSQPSTNPVGIASLGLAGTGAAASDFAWTKFTGPYTAGEPNTGQTFTAPLQSQGIAFDNLSVRFVPGGDTDGDGSKDADELVFGTSPSDADSRQRVSIVRLGTTQNRLEFSTVTGRSYTVQSSDDFEDWQDGAVFSGTGSLRNADLTIAPGFPALFYRLKVTID